MTLSLNKPKLDNLAADIWKSAARLWYLRATASFGWSRNVLLNQIKGRGLPARRQRKEDPQFRPRPAGFFAPTGLYPPAQGWPACGPTLGTMPSPPQPQRGCGRRETPCLNRYPPFISIWCFPPRVANRSCGLRKPDRKCTPISEVFPKHWTAHPSLSGASKIMCISSAGWGAASRSPIG